MNRRAFLRIGSRSLQATLLGATGLATTHLLRAGSETAAPPSQSPLRPPGAVPERALAATCTGCYLCGQVCSVRAIRFPSRVTSSQSPRLAGPARTGWDLRQTPAVLPWIAGCNLCLRCGRICPTGALRPIPDDPGAVRPHVAMGTAVIDRKICLPYNRRSWCGACHTICPLRGRAITVDHQNRPEIHAEHCVGCGLCVEVCPLRHKAVAVVPPFPPTGGALLAG